MSIRDKLKIFDKKLLNYNIYMFAEDMKSAVVAENALEASDKKTEENRPPLKINFKRSLFSSLLLSDVPSYIFGNRGRFHVYQRQIKNI